MYCPNCGQAIADGSTTCAVCGANLAPQAAPQQPVQQYQQPEQQYQQTQQAYQQPYQQPVAPAAPKSKMAAGLLGIFLGALGIHNFYLGFTKKAVIQLVVSLVGSLLFGLGPIAMGIWGLVEGILYLTGSKNVDADGNPLA